MVKELIDLSKRPTKNNRFELSFTSLYNEQMRQTDNERKRDQTCQNGFLVSTETVVLRRWERSKQKFSFIKRVDKG